MAEVELAGVRKSFDAVDVIKGVDLKIEHGEFVVFVGPSGCGKSTLLRLIAGLETVTSGRLRIAGDDVTNIAPAKRGVAMVFQSYALFPHMTVAENISFGLRLAGTPKSEIDAQVGKVAETLELTHLLDRRPKQLSGGQRQRVAIGRAIIRNPKVFLFDEPLSNLDAALRNQMRIEISRLHEQLKSTMIYVTHDQIEAMTLADRIVVLNEGVIEQVGTPMELYLRPRNMFVAGFIGSPKMNFLPAVIMGQGDTLAADLGDFMFPLSLASQVDEGMRVTLGFRPEDISPLESGRLPVCHARAVHKEQLGSETLVYYRGSRSDDLLLIRMSGQFDCGSRGETALYAAPEAIHVFDQRGNRIA
ncbi:MAG: sn-glycerol-3-phosphate ABC transporter ATP-binding protein UgpC [Alphaproteobacteria bacterium]|nr:sn-glycerol-3-phosphate ABC transporter ATP-binding protein UgpC [Alphaproteobacteria bacterium]